MAQSKAAPPKSPRPTPGPGDTNTPPQVAEVNAAQAAIPPPGEAPGAPAPAAAPEASSASSPQGPPVAAPGEGATPSEPVQYAEPQGPEDLPTNERDQALFGPDETPGQGGLMEGARYSSSGSPAPNVQSVYEAAQDPMAPPAFRQMVQLLQHFYGSQGA